MLHIRRAVFSIEIANCLMVQLFVQGRVCTLKLVGIVVKAT